MLRRRAGPLGDADSKPTRERDGRTLGAGRHDRGMRHRGSRHTVYLRRPIVRLAPAAEDEQPLRPRPRQHRLCEFGDADGALPHGRQQPVERTAAQKLPREQQRMVADTAAHRLPTDGETPTALLDGDAGHRHRVRHHQPADRRHRGPQVAETGAHGIRHHIRIGPHRAHRHRRHDMGGTALPGRRGGLSRPRRIQPRPGTGQGNGRDIRFSVDIRHEDTPHARSQLSLRRDAPKEMRRAEAGHR